METPTELNEIINYFPKYWEEAGHLFTKTLYEESQLDRKSIELILCSLLAARRWQTGVRVHVGLAIEHGATAGEIRGALLLSAGVAGLSAAVQALHWAEDILVGL